MKPAVLLAMALIGLADEAPAADVYAGLYMDGSRLHDMCGSQRQVVSGYVAGAADALSMVDQLLKRKPTLCIPANLNTIDLSDLLCKYVNDHPEMRQYSSAALAVIAIQDVFPCGR